MCVIIHQPEGSHLSKERAERLWKKNPDGGGFVFLDNGGKFGGWKTMEFQEFWKLFEQTRSQFPGRDFMLHMRIATHGTVNLDNVHPFRVDEHTMMAHNGIIHGVPDDPTNQLSDTRIFIRDVLPRLPETWLDDEYLTDMVQEWIGWSKLMFLTNNPKLEKKVYILNEEKGTNADGMWFSNGAGVYKTVVTTAKGSYHRRPDHSKTGGKYQNNLGWEWDDDNVAWPTPGDPVVPSEASLYRIPLPTPKATENLDEKKVILELLREVRESEGLDKRITYNKEEGTYGCWGCDEEVDVKTGECECWDKVCTDCFNVAALCSCPQGWSSNLSYWDQATPEVQEQALKGA